MQTKGEESCQPILPCGFPCGKVMKLEGACADEGFERYPVAPAPPDARSFLDRYPRACRQQPGVAHVQLCASSVQEIHVRANHGLPVRLTHVRDVASPEPP